MTTRMTLPALFVLTLLAGACAKQYPFPTAPSTNRGWQDRYNNMEHNISTLRKYDFRILIPKNWEILDTAIDRDPLPQELLDVAAFREPGEWMTTPGTSAKGEVAVSVFAESGAIANTPHTHREWLFSALQKNMSEYVLLQEGKVHFINGDEPDLLIRYGSAKDEVVARIRIVPAGDGRLFVLTASAPAADYPRLAQDFFMALDSFRLQGGSGESKLSSSGAQSVRP